MSTSRLGVAVVFAMLIAVAGCGQKAPEQPQPQGKATEQVGAKGLVSLTEDEIRQSGLKAERLEPRTLRERLSLTATIQMNQDRIAHIEPRVNGRIVKVTANLGERVKMGQTLAVLDSLEVGEAHSTYLQAQSEFRLAQSSMDRVEKLHAEDILPQKEYLRVRAEHEKARVAVRAAEDRLRMLGVTPAQGTVAVSVFPLTSPFAGTVVEKDAVLGELAETTKVLFTVADLSTLWIEADVLETDLKYVQLGVPAEVSVAAFPDEKFRGRVAYLSSQMNRETRTLKARIDVVNPGERLRPQMFAKVEIAGPASTQTLAVPTEAVVLLQGQPHVFVAKDGGYEPRPVESGLASGGLTALRRGVEVGETVVVAGAYALKAKMLKSQISDTH